MRKFALIITTCLTLLVGAFGITPHPADALGYGIVATTAVGPVGCEWDTWYKDAVATGYPQAAVDLNSSVDGDTTCQSNFLYVSYTNPTGNKTRCVIACNAQSYLEQQLDPSPYYVTANEAGSAATAVSAAVWLRSVTRHDATGAGHTPLGDACSTDPGYTPSGEYWEVYSLHWYGVNDGHSPNGYTDSIANYCVTSDPNPNE